MPWLPRRKALIVAVTVVALATLAVWRSSASASIDRAAGTVVDVVAADLLLVEVDGRRERVRLLGAVAAEGATTTAATAWVDAAHRRVRLLTEDVPQRDDSGDWLAYVHREDGGGPTLNEALIAAGDAFAERRFDYAYATTFAAAESAARKAEAGVWQSLPSDPPMPAWRAAWLEGERRARG